MSILDSNLFNFCSSSRWITALCHVIDWFAYIVVTMGVYAVLASNAAASRHIETHFCLVVARVIVAFGVAVITV